MDTTNSTILVTGGTSGIGRGLAERLHAAGSTVIVAGRRADLLAEVVAANPGMDAVVLDVADPASIRAAVDSVVSRHPAIDVVINNAGIMEVEDLTQPGFLDVAERTVVTNLLGPIRVLDALLPVLLGQQSSTIVNVTSGLAYVPLPVTPTYNATKAALHSYTESLRVQLAGTSVEVVELAPPGVRTALMGQEDDATAMPLEEFLDEVMHLLQTQPNAPQVLVERVKGLRFAEARGTYDDMLELLSGVGGHD